MVIRMKMAQTGKMLAMLLALLLLLGMVPVSAVGPGKETAEPPAQPAAEPTFTEVDVDGDTLKAYLELDGNYKINVTGDITVQIGEAGDTHGSYVDYWANLGTGTKVLNLNGHEIAVSNDAVDSGTTVEGFVYMCSLFGIGSGAELVVNDPGNEGKITYKCLLKKDSRVNYRINSRNIFTVNRGGKLTVNGGNIVAGRRSEKYYDSVNMENFYLQTNGVAIMINGGAVTVNGGKLEGRGYLCDKNPGYYSDYEYDGYVALCEKAAAVYLISGSLKIYDGVFIGNGNADALHIKDKGTVEIYGGSFDTTKTDCKIYTYYEELWLNVAKRDEDPAYGNIGIPGRAFKNVGTRTRVYKKDTGYLTAEQVSAEETLETSKYVNVSPVEEQTGSMLLYNGETNSFEDVAMGTVIEWDKVTSLRFQFAHLPYYPHDLRSYDVLEKYVCKKTCAAIRTSPDALNCVPALFAPDGREWVDLNDLPQSSKDKLAVGGTYYVRMVDTEEWKSTPTARTVFFEDLKLIKIKIVEPDLTMPDLDVGLTWSHTLDASSQKPVTRLAPTGDGTADRLNALIALGKISSYTATFTYVDGSGKQAKISTTDTVSPIAPDSFYRGISTAKYAVDLYKGGRKMGTAPAPDCRVVCFPELEADKTVDSQNRVLVEASASDKKVTLSCSPNSSSGLFWAKDGTKLTDSAEKKTYTVDLGTASNIGWYSLGYTVDGKDYISEQEFYLGIKEGERNLSLACSASMFTVKADGDATPTLTATAGGTGWGTITEYRWKNVSWPEGADPTALMRRTTKNTISVAEMFSYETGHETELVAGYYRFTVTAYDNYGKQVTSNQVMTRVVRPAQGLEIWHDVESEAKDSVNVTDGFLVLDGESGADVIRTVATPKNASAIPGTPTFTSSDTGVVTVADGGILKAKAAGSAAVTAKHGGCSASTRVLVPKTKYEVTVPEDWLKVTAGGTVHRGAIPDTPDDFTAELVWYVQGSTGEYTSDTFVGDTVYYPELRICPKAGVCYPVEIDYQHSRTDYVVDKDRFEFIVNGVKYYGADYCKADVFYDEEPVSSGSAQYDRIDLDMDPTGKIIDPRDEYVDLVVFHLEAPYAGDPKDVSEDALTNLNCVIDADGIVSGGDNVWHITDLSTIRDQKPGNDATEEFTVYEAGETYRCTVYLLPDRTYATPSGGKVRFADTVTATEPDLGAITSRSGSVVQAYVYFTVTERPPEPKVVFTGASFGDALTVSLKKAEDLEGAVYVIAACYDDGGRMLASERREAGFTDNKAEEVFTFKNVRGKIARAKLFALDADARPLALARDVLPES